MLIFFNWFFAYLFISTGFRGPLPPRSLHLTVACATSTSASGVEALPLGLLIAPRAETSSCGPSSAPLRCERCGAFASDLDVFAESVSGAVAGVRKTSRRCVFCGAEAAHAPAGAGGRDTSAQPTGGVARSAAARFTLRERQPSANVKVSAATHVVFVVDATMTKARLELVASAIEGALEAMPAKSSISLIAYVRVASTASARCAARLSAPSSFLALPCPCARK